MSAIRSKNPQRTRGTFGGLVRHIRDVAPKGILEKICCEVAPRRTVLAGPGKDVVKTSVAAANDCAGLGNGDTHDAPFNIAEHLPRRAEEAPGRLAVVCEAKGCGHRGSGRSAVTFAELETLTNRYANGLVDAGFRPGMRVLLMVRRGVEFIGLVFALFKIGAAPVLIDPGMGVGRMLECLKQVDLQGFVGIPLAHVIRVLRRSPFQSVKAVVTVGRRWFWAGPTLAELTSRAASTFALVRTRPDDPAAILFTSGSTGPAKGVVYEHGMFGAQVRMIQSRYGIEPGEIDLPTFPLFGLFSVAMGMTAVIPDMDASRPGHADPAKIVDAIQRHAATSSFGSPALWRRVARYCLDRGVRLPTLKRILVAGAPVSPSLIADLRAVLAAEADVHTPYGATESLPVSSISGKEVIDHTAARTRRGLGICVGRKNEGTDVRIIRVSDDPIAEWSSELLVGAGEIGEIVVSGPMVTKAYFGMTQATSAAKIQDGGRVWHRMGDVGYFDADGRLWFCGRKAHRVRVSAEQTLFSVCCEAIFNEHAEVGRSALVGIGPPTAQTPIIVIEPGSGRVPTGRRREQWTSELRQLAQAAEHTKGIWQVLFRRRLPVDVRHNAKINREALAVWAFTKCR